jgi:glutamyl-tRNA synthetase
MLAAMSRPAALYRGRFAPSPTGQLHLGGAATATFAFAAARRVEGRLVLRVDDLDRARVVEGSEATIEADLAWLGLVFDENPASAGPYGPYRQSERLERYELAVVTLAERGLTYLCDCSRAEIARAASAPHVGEEGTRYPGTCRRFGMRDRAFKRPPALRLAIPDATRVRYVDAVRGEVEVDVHARAGDFVLRRGDGVYAYHLACAVDELTMGISEVVRGADLEPSAALQVLLIELLGGRAPRYVHVPLLVGPDGTRLAKRTRGSTVDELRASGASAGAVVRALASAYGHPLPASASPLDALAAMWDPRRLPTESVFLRAVLAELP